jgi:hypothetical protein
LVVWVCSVEEGRRNSIFTGTEKRSAGDFAADEGGEEVAGVGSDGFELGGG